MCNTNCKRLRHVMHPFREAEAVKRGAGLSSFDKQSTQRTHNGQLSGRSGDWYLSAEPLRLDFTMLDVMRTLSAPAGRLPKRQRSFSAAVGRS
jgi:hypothetical protein